MNSKLYLENDEYLYKYQVELFQTLHEYTNLLRAHHIYIVCLQHGWLWNNNILNRKIDISIFIVSLHCINI